MLQAVIMAGGTGSRLRPLTCDLPKPMARLCGRPNVEYILELLERHGITHAALALQYLPQCVTEHFPDARFGDVVLDFSLEEEPLGTAGSVRHAARDFALGQGGEELFVISGDAMCDFDLTAALRRHRESGACATLIVKGVEDPREYGLVAEQGGFVAGFVEKPCYAQAISRLANTGVYILGREAAAQIPARKPYDFAQDLFPKLLSQGRRIAVYEDGGYWCDIGDVEAYRRCQGDMLRGLVKCSIGGKRDENGSIWRAQRPVGAYTVNGPVYVGENVSIGEGAVLEAGAVIDDGATVCPGARVTASIVLQNAYVGNGCTLSGAVLCAGAAAQSGAMLFENAVLGTNARAGERCTLQPGVRVWPEKCVEAGVIQRDNVKYGCGSTRCFEDEGLTGEAGVELTPELAVRIGLAAGGSTGGGRVGVGCTEDRAARVLCRALVAGIQSAGGDVLDFGPCFEAQFCFGVAFCGLSRGIYVQGGRPARVRLVAQGGLPAPRAQERAVEGALLRGEFSRRPAAEFGEVSALDGVRALYETELLRHAPHGLSGLSVSVRAPRGPAEVLRPVLRRLGAHDDGPIAVHLSADGKTAHMSWQSGVLSHAQLIALGCLPELEQGGAVALPYDAPRVMEKIAKEAGGRILRYLSCPADGSDGEARRLAAAQLWSRDGLMLALRVLTLARVRGMEPDELGSLLPPFSVEELTVQTGKNPALALGTLGAGPKAGAGVGDGVLVEDERGVLLLRPLKRGGALRVRAEARDAEIARELCEDYRARLEKIVRTNTLDRN